ncbi:LysR substrate-binding domain-containing protein [Amycolatopsis sp. NPDC051071]|uniref:LysR substrate-binding domain-containing protein n=1 Tax=Amycolatopsis sp. NPDC051071 TaxID=3154637 RepID=UPI003418207F
MLSKAELIADEVDLLEDRIGGLLLERGGFTLTALGETLREGVRGGVAGIGAAIAECRVAARRTGGRLRIGYVASIGGDFAANLASEFERRNPGCRVSLTPTRIGTGSTGRELLAEDDLDLVLHWSPGRDGQALALPGLSVGPVIREVQRAVVVPAGHPLARRTSISVEDLADFEVIDPGKALNPLARDLWTPSVTPSGRRVRLTEDDLTDLVGRRSIGAEDVLALVARGYGVHLTVASVLDRYPFPGLTLVPVTDLPPMVVVPVWRAAGETHLIRAFVASLSVA